MRTAFRFSARFLMIVAVLTVIAGVIAPAGQSQSPYVSALSDLTVGSAVIAAKPGCNNAACGTDGRRCLADQPGQRCTINFNTQKCRTSSC